MSRDPKITKSNQDQLNHALNEIHPTGSRHFKDWIRLKVMTGPEWFDQSFYLQVSVHRKWLNQRINSETGRARINIDEALFLEWMRSPHGDWIPFLNAFGEEFQVHRRLLDPKRLGDRLGLSISCIAQFSNNFNALDVDNNAFAPCTILSGGVRLWTQGGFLQDKLVGSSRQVKKWLKNVWPESKIDTAAIYFGESAIQLDIINTDGDEQSRKRVSLQAIKDGKSLWLAVPCKEALEVGDPNSILHNRFIELESALSKGSFPLSVMRKVGHEEQSVGVYYLVAPQSSEEAGLSVQEFIQSDFLFSFRSEEIATTWAPRTLIYRSSGLENSFTLQDDDVVAGFLNNIVVAEKAISPFDVDLKWDIDGSSLRHSPMVAKIPELFCLGADSHKLAGGEYLWAHQRIDSTPLMERSLSAWVRYHLPDAQSVTTANADENGRIKGLSDAVTIDRNLLDGWSLSVDLPRTSGEEPEHSNSRMRCIITVASTEGSPQQASLKSIELSFSGARVRAKSPQLDVYNRFLNAPAAPPNDQAYDQSLNPASMVFGNEPPKFPLDTLVKAVDDSTPLIRALYSSTDKLFHFASSGKATTVFLPYEWAGIDPVSPSLGNLKQQRDETTGRTIVARDVNHGLTPWSVSSFLFQTQKNGPVTLFPSKKDFLPHSSLEFALALAPWVQWRDPLLPDGEVQRTLHHRNLVLEHGEFASASQDRSVDGKPTALPANRRDFVNAVRDPFTIAANDLPLSKNQAAPVVNWFPGASLVAGDPAEAWSPTVWLDMPQVKEDLQERLPVIHTSQPDGSSHSLLLQHTSKTQDTVRQEWLSYDVRWLPQTTVTVRPKLKVREVKNPASESGTEDWVRVRNASAPLLFDLADVTATALGQMGKQTVMLSGGSDGALRIYDALTGQFVDEVFTYEDGAVAAPEVKAAYAGRLNGADYIAAVSGLGQVWIWQTDSSADAMPQLIPGLPKSEQPCATATIIAAADRLFIVICYIDGQVTLWIWGPADKNKLIAEPLPEANPVLSIASAMASSDSGMVVLLIAFGMGHSARLLKCTRSIEQWAVSELKISADGMDKASKVALIVTGGAIWLALQDGDESVKIFSESRSGPGSASDLTIQTIDFGNVPQPVTLLALVESNKKLYLVGESKEGTHRWNVEKLDASTSLSAKTLHDGEHTSFATGAFIVPPYSEAQPHLLTGGRDGFMHLLDIEAGYLRCSVQHQRKVYDNLGAVRPTASRNPAPQGCLIDFVNHPHCTNVDQAASLSGYREHESEITLSFSSDQPLVSHGDPSENLSEIYFSCEGLKAYNTSDNGWVLEDFPNSCPVDGFDDNGFPFHRGYQGVYGFYSTISGEQESSVDYWPRVAGIPVYIVAIQKIGFDEEWNISAMVLEAVLTNPLDTIGHTAFSGVPMFVRRAVNRGSTILITLGQKAGERVMKLVVTNVTTADSRLIQWDMPSAMQVMNDFPRRGFPGKLTTLSASVSYQRYGQSSQRIILKTNSEHSSAAALGDDWNLTGEPLSLVGSGNKDGCAFKLVDQIIDGKALPANNIIQPGITLSGSEEPVTAVAFGNPQHDFVALTGSRDGVTRMWDAATGLELKRFQVLVTAVAASMIDGQEWIVTGASDHHTRLWNDNCTVQKRYSDHTLPIRSIALEKIDSVIGWRLISAGDDGQVVIRHAAKSPNDNPPLRTILHNAEVTAVVVAQHEERRYLLSACRDGVARLWSDEKVWGDEDKLADPLLFQHGAALTAVAYHTTSVHQWIATGGIDNSVLIWRVEYFSEEIDTDKMRPVLIRRLKHSSEITAVEFTMSKGHLLLLSASLDGTVQQITVSAENEEPPVVYHHGAEINDLKTIESMEAFVTAGADGVARRWCIELADHIKPVLVDDTVTTILLAEGVSLTALSLQLNAGCLRVVVGTNSGSALTATAPVASEEPGSVNELRHSATINAVDSARLQMPHVALFSGNQAQVSDAQSGAIICRVEHDVPLVDIGLAGRRSDARLVTAGIDGIIKVWNPLTGKLLLTFVHGSELKAVDITAPKEGESDDYHIASVGGDESVRIWNTRTGQEDLTNIFEQVKGFTCLVIDGHKGSLRVLAGGVENSENAWLWRQGVGKTEIKELGATAQSLQFAFNGSRPAILVGTSAGQARLYEIDDLTKPPIEFPSGIDKGVTSVAFSQSPDGKTQYIAIGGIEGDEDGTGEQNAALWKRPQSDEGKWEENEIPLTLLAEVDNISVALVLRRNRMAVLITRSRAKPSEEPEALESIQTAQLWSADTIKEIHRFHLPATIDALGMGLKSVAVADMPVLHLLTGEGRMASVARLWDARTGILRGELDHGGIESEQGVTCVRFLIDDDKTEVVTAFGKEVMVWNLSDEAKMHTLQHGSKVTTLDTLCYQQPNNSFCHRYVLIGGDAQQATLFDLRVPDNPLIKLDGHEGGIVSTALTENRSSGALIALTAGKDDKEVAQWLIDESLLSLVMLDNIICSMPEDTDTSGAVRVADIVIKDERLGIDLLTLAGEDAAFFEIKDKALRLKAGTTLDTTSNPVLDVSIKVDAAPNDVASLSIIVTAEGIPQVTQPGPTPARLRTYKSEETTLCSSVAFTTIGGESHILIGRNSGAELWTAPDNPDQQAVERWRFSRGKASPVVLASASTEDAPRVLTALKGSLDVNIWEVEGYLSFDNMTRPSHNREAVGQLDYHLAIDLQAKGIQDENLSFTASISSGNRLNLFVAAAGASRQLAIPSIRQGIYYGFLLGVTRSDRLHARSILTLWREKGMIAGILVDESLNTDATATFTSKQKGEIEPFQAKGIQLTQTTTVFGFEHSIRPFGKGTKKKTTNISHHNLTSAWFTATREDDEKFSIQIGEQLQTFPSESDRLTPMIAHLTACSGAVQTSIQLLPSADNDQRETPQFIIEPGVFRVTAVDLSILSGASRQDILFPNIGSRSIGFDLITTDEKAPANKDDPLYVQLFLNAEGIAFKPVDASQVPVNLCLEPEAEQPIPNLGIRTTQLIHRELFGQRLRLRLPEMDHGIFNIGEDNSTDSWKPEKSNGSHWLLSPVVATSTQAFVFNQKLWVGNRSDEINSNRQTENLLIVQKESNLSASTPPIVSLTNVTARSNGDDLLLTSDIHSLLKKVGIDGVAVVRTVREGSVGEYRYVSSPLFTSSRQPQQIKKQTTQESDSRLLVLDFRLLSPYEARRWKLRSSATYRPARPIRDRDLETGRLAFRRFKLIREHINTDNDIKAESHGNEELYRYQVLESTAFNHMQSQWHLPKHRVIPDAPNRHTFQPISIEFQYAPDKPGAMIHHKLQSLTEHLSQSVDDWDMGPMAAFALRDPEQFTPPTGAKIELLKALELNGGKSLFAQSFGVDRYEFHWQETLGAIALILDETATEVEISQPNQPSDEMVLKSDNLMQLIVQINEDLLDIDATRGHFPVYDARQAAGKVSTHRPPNFFIISKIDDLLDPTNGQELKVINPLTKEENNITVIFTPYLIFESPAKDQDPPLVTTIIPLKEVMTKPVPFEPTIGEHYFISRNKALNHEQPTDVQIPWQNAQTIRIAWQGEHTFKKVDAAGNQETKTVPFEAVLFDALGQKSIKLVPYSAVAPKMAAVLLLDEHPDKKPKECQKILQKTLLFGDSAATSEGEGSVEMVKETPHFVFKTRDNETVVSETIEPSSNGHQIKRSLILVKYLIYGQVICTSSGIIKEYDF